MVRSEEREERFDAAVLALPGPELAGIVDAESGDHCGADPLSGVYLGVVAVVLTLRRSLSPYYVINLLDPALPFTGIIETTNVLPPHTVGSRRLVYLPKYILPRHRLESASDQDVLEEFRRGLQIVFPDFEEDDVEHQAVVRAAHVQPLGAPRPESFVSSGAEPGLGIHRTESMESGASPRTMNAQIAAGRKAAQAILADFAI
jgi:protoporphyrinogen oxidase